MTYFFDHSLINDSVVVFFSTLSEPYKSANPVKDNSLLTSPVFG